MSARATLVGPVLPSPSIMAPPAAFKRSLKTDYTHHLSERSIRPGCQASAGQQCDQRSLVTRALRAKQPRRPTIDREGQPAIVGHIDFVRVMWPRLLVGCDRGPVPVKSLF